MRGCFLWCGEVCISLWHLIKYSCSCKTIASRCLTSDLIRQPMLILLLCIRTYVRRWLLHILKEWPNFALVWEGQSEPRVLLLAFCHFLHRCCRPHCRCCCCCLRCHHCYLRCHHCCLRRQHCCLCRQRCRQSSPSPFCSYLKHNFLSLLSSSPSSLLFIEWSCC